MKIKLAIQAAFLLAWATPLAFSQGYLISTAAADFPLPLTLAAQTVVDNPKAVAVDSSGNAYFIGNNCAYKLNVTGTLTRIAGRIPAFQAYSGNGGNATEAGLNNPSGLAVDAAGTVYIADTGNNVIRKVTLDGLIQTAAGNGTAGYSGDGGQATNAKLNQPSGIAVDSSGILYIADTSNQRIRKVASDGTISTIAGDGTPGYSGDEGQASTARLNTPVAIAVDSARNVYVSDFNNTRVRKISRGGIIATIAGPSPYFYPQGLSVDGGGNVFVANGITSQILEVANNGNVAIIAGTGIAGYSGDGGSATNAQLFSPKAVVADASGNLYIADQGNGRIRKIASGTVSTIAGTGTTSATPGTGPANSSLNYGLALDASRNIFTADYNNNVVHKVVADGTATTVVGTGVAGFSGDGGQAVNAQLSYPTGLAIDTAGNLYICDAGNHRVRKVATDGTITTFAGSGQVGYTGDGGSAVNAALDNPVGITVDTSGNVYFADEGANVVRKVSGGNISTVAGTGTAGFSGDGGQATSATLNQPSDVAVDASGNILITDAGNGRLRKIASGGIITTLATASSLSGVTVDAAGNAYLTLPTSDTIEEVTPGGTVTTVAGTAGAIGYAGDGGPAASAQLNFPTGITIDASGHIYFSDTHNFSVRELTPTGANAVLTVLKAHTGVFMASQAGANYSVTVTNAAGAGASSGTITVADNVPPGLSLVSMSGSGWSCTSNVCTRGDVLGAGSSFPPITVSVNVDSNPAAQVANFVAMYGGGSSGTTDDDYTNILPSAVPIAPSLLSPSNGAPNVATSPTLTWSASTGAVSYDVYFGTTATPPFVINTNQTSYSPGTLAIGATYYWDVVARNGSGTASSAVWSFTTASSCSYAISPTAAAAFFSGGSEALDVSAGAGCTSTATSNASWLAVTSGASGNGNAEVQYSIAANPYASQRIGTLTVAGQTFTVYQAGNPTGLEFIPVTPCRIADTRNTAGPFGGPILGAGSSRQFNVPASACNIPTSAIAYSVNATVLPTRSLGYLTLWTTGQSQPGVSTLNSDGRVKANAAIVVAGTNGGVNVFVTDQTHFILDIDGYFVAKGTANALGFHPLPPCRVADTRQGTGSLGGPALSSGATRSFPVLSSACGIPNSAQAYSMNFTALPHGSLGFLTTWPSGQPQPIVSTLNASTGAVTANAAIVPAGTSGAISVFASNTTDVLIDIDGYFDSTQTNALSFYPIAPCRAADSRYPAGSPPFSGTVPLNLAGSSCGVPTAQAYLANATVVPTGSLGFLTLWANGQPQPGASTLNAYDGAVTSNMAIVPSTNGSIDAFASNPTYAILDLLGYFNP